MGNNNDIVIPEDLIIGILPRLSIFSLVRFRCVCKSWYSLLSDPKFIYKSLFFVESDHRPDDTKILIKLQLKCGDPYVYCCLSYDSLTVETPYRDWPVDLGVRVPSINKRPGLISSACGGLICLHYPGGSAGVDGYSTVLFNPATSETKVFSPPVDLPYSEYSGIWTTTGFGFDQQTNEYKVVRIRDLYKHAESCRLCVIHVCSMGDDSWRELDDSVGMILPPLPHFKLYGHELPQYCPRVRLSGRSKGKCFWVGRSADYDESDKTITIVSFDMSSEAFQVGKTLPDPCGRWYYVYGFAPSVFMLKEETVAIYHCVGDSLEEDPGAKIEMWVLQQFGSVGESWYKVLSITPSPYIVMGPKGLSKDGRVICVTFDDRLLVLDPTTGQAYALPVRGLYHCVELVTYVPSVLPILSL